MSSQNKMILRQRLSSIEHYTREIEKLEEAKEVTKSTREEIVNSLAEFFPWGPGDVIYRSGRILKIGLLKGARLAWNEKIVFSAEVYKNTRNGWENNPNDETFEIEDLQTWKIIEHGTDEKGVAND